MDQIQKLWEQHEEAQFPAGHRNRTVEGVNLTLIDTEISGFILTFLATGGALGARQTIALNKGIASLKKIIPQLDSAAQPYFQHLLDLSEEVLKSSHPPR